MQRWETKEGNKAFEDNYEHNGCMVGLHTSYRLLLETVGVGGVVKVFFTKAFKPGALDLTVRDHGRFQDFRLGRAAYCEGAGWWPKCGPICFKILADWGGPWPCGPPPGTAHGTNSAVSPNFSKSAVRAATSICSFPNPAIPKSTTNSSSKLFESSQCQQFPSFWCTVWWVSPNKSRSFST